MGTPPAATCQGKEAGIFQELPIWPKPIPNEGSRPRQRHILQPRFPTMAQLNPVPSVCVAVAVHMALARAARSGAL
jgi:hypothetical protein